MRVLGLLVALVFANSVAQMVPELPGLDLGTKPLYLLQRNEVVNELKLDGKQKSEVKKIIAAYNVEMKKIAEEAQKNTATAFASYGKLGPMTDEYGKQAVSLLTPEQAKRLSQVRWQVLGSMCLAEPDVQTALELGEDQKGIINDIAKDVPKNRMKILIDNARDPKNLKKRLDAYRDEVDAVLFKVLTPGQAEKYKLLLGEPFKDLKKIRG